MSLHAIMLSRSQSRIMNPSAIAPLQHCVHNSSGLFGIRPFANAPAVQNLLSQLPSSSQVRYSSHDARSRRAQLTKKPENAKLNPPLSVGHLPSPFRSEKHTTKRSNTTSPWARRTSTFSRMASRTSLRTVGFSLTD
ncbi:hypothetical protein V2G26_008565 [Clonostachys chloroleuca]